MSTKSMGYLLLMLPAIQAGAADWQLLSREEGCVPIEILVRHERLPHVPSSPQDFVDMLRAQGRSAEMGPVPGFPADHANDFVMVKVDKSTAPIFVRREACGRIDAGRR